MRFGGCHCFHASGLPISHPPTPWQTVDLNFHARKCDNKMHPSAHQLGMDIRIQGIWMRRVRPFHQGILVARPIRPASIKMGL